MATTQRTYDLEASALKASLRGELIQLGDEGYDAARTVYNGMIDKRPALIARCADVADVIAAVNFARENNLLVSIRGGGHNAGGLGVCDDGLVIDLSLIRYTHVDPVARTVRVGGGCTWGDVDHATHAFSLAVPSGIISTTGVGGLTLGGGLGYLTRKYGLAIDNLIAADVVLADGRLVTANESRNADLFWALRGGGGNFGVVTSFVFKANPVHTVYGGPMLWEMDQAPAVMKWYREFIMQAPDDLNGFFAFLIVPPGPPFPEHLHSKNMCGVVWCYTGPTELAQAVLGGCTPLFGRRRVCEFHDGRGGSGARQSLLSRQLRAPGGHQAQVRSHQFLSRESEHQAHHIRPPQELGSQQEADAAQFLWLGQSKDKAGGSK